MVDDNERQAENAQAAVRMLNEDEYSEEARKAGAFNEQYMSSEGMTPYAKAAAHYPPYLENEGREALHTMPTNNLGRQLKETMAVAVSMVNGCSYCIMSHSHLLREMFDYDDAEVAELAAVVAHVSGLNQFEKSTMGKDEPLFPLKSKSEVPILQEIDEELGLLPKFYRVMAHDPELLDIVWERNQMMMADDGLNKQDKLYTAFVVSMVNNAPEAIHMYRDILGKRGATMEELFEATAVTQTFHKDNVFASGLNIEAEEWQRPIN